MRRRASTEDADLFWLNRDYLPEFAALFAGRPSPAELAGAIGGGTEPVLVPWDCADGFYHAFWRRPWADLDERVRRGMSVWARVGPDAERRVVHSLRDDLASGRWAARNRDLSGLDAAELGLRLLIACAPGTGRPRSGDRPGHPHPAACDALLLSPGRKRFSVRLVKVSEWAPHTSEFETFGAPDVRSFLLLPCNARLGRAHMERSGWLVRTTVTVARDSKMCR